MVKQNFPDYGTFCFVHEYLDIFLCVQQRITHKDYLHVVPFDLIAERGN